MLVLRIWQDQPGDYFCISTKSANKEWRDTFFHRDEFDEVAEFIKESKGKDVYFCPHGFSKKKRRKEYAVLPHCLYADLDEADPRTIKYRPTIAIESSPDRYVGIWMTDREITEELNRRLAYAVGADNSGWDLTQVLRVPGTTNYKYNSNPRVKILWSDGPSYKISELQKSLPGVSRDSPNNEESDASAVYKRWEAKIPAWARRELMAAKATPGKRSEMIWKLETTLLEAGLPTADILTLIKGSVWNKFAGRRNEDQQLARELDKAINRHLHGDRTVIGEEEAGTKRLVFRTMDTVEEEDLDWLWFPYLARGELTIIEGDPGVNKSLLMMVAAIHLCDGKAMPTVGKPIQTTGRVLAFDLENSVQTVVKPRLRVNRLKNWKSYSVCEEGWSIDDEDAMEEVIDYFEKTKPDLVIFDTLNAYLGKADSYNGQEAQQTMIRFKELARRYNCSVVVVRHLTKSTKGSSPIYRGQGSISITGLARVVMTVGYVPDDSEDMRAMIPVKLNVAQIPPALKFEVVNSGGYPKIRFKDFDESLSAREILSADRPKKDASIREATTFLTEILDDGPMEEDRIRRMASLRSIEDRALDAAFTAMGLKVRKKGKKDLWELAPEGGRG